MNLDIHRAEQFQRWIDEALSVLRTLGWYAHPEARASVLRSTQACVKVALRYANNLNCAARKGLCLTVLSWLRADLNRITERSAA